MELEVLPPIAHDTSTTLSAVSGGDTNQLENLPLRLPIFDSVRVFLTAITSATEVMFLSHYVSRRYYEGVLRDDIRLTRHLPLV